MRNHDDPEVFRKKHDKLVELLEKVQTTGDTFDMNELIRDTSDLYMRRIGRYLSRNRTVENEDLKQEFMIGIALAVPKARLDIGDPIEFLVAQGVYRVRGLLRKSVISQTVQQCNECGNISRLNRIDNVYICKKCGSSNIVTTELSEHNEIAMANAEDKSLAVDEEVMSEIMIAQFERTLKEGTNVHNLYILLKSGVNRDNPAVKNYIKEIARIWGGCSEQNVVQALNKLQARVMKFAEENGMVIVGNRFVMKDGE